MKSTNTCIVGSIKITNFQTKKHCGLVQDWLLPAQHCPDPTGHNQRTSSIASSIAHQPNTYTIYTIIVAVSPEQILF